jgi:ABC-type multidrug transport system ATPase subunit
MLAIRQLARLTLGPLDLVVEAGECVAVMGPSGSGKTLLLRAIADLDPNDGQVSLEERAREAMPAPQWRRLVTYVPAESGWWEDVVGAHFERPEEAATMLEALRLPAEALRWDVGRLSTGERQRLALVRAILQGPRVLLLDEPTSGLDTDAAGAVEDLLRGLLERGTAMLLVTHDRRQARRLARRCLVIEQGRVREDWL